MLARQTGGKCYSPIEYAIAIVREDYYTSPIGIICIESDGLLSPGNTQRFATFCKVAVRLL